MERRKENLKVRVREKMKPSWRREKLENESNVWRKKQIRKNIL